MLGWLREAELKPGPTGEELATDTAWVGPASAKKVLVTTSATHGVEGYFGSATQVEWLRRATGDTLPQDVAALHIHAINPYGFAWMRRTLSRHPMRRKSRRFAFKTGFLAFHMDDRSASICDEILEKSTVRIQKRHNWHRAHAATLD
jgi:Protein of unknown function (DUF2817)